MQRLAYSLAAEQKVEARPRKWLIPLILLWLQEESFSYGYEIMERLEEEFGFEQINPGSVYRTLRQMEKEGLCESEWEISANGGPARRMYAISEAGETYLDAWADACKQYQQVIDSFSRVYRNRVSRSSE
jgi:PadR family transcriptional regulator, regulatory protein PadR